MIKNHDQPGLGRDKNMDVPLYRVAPLKRKKRVMTAVIMVGRTEVKTSGLLNEVNM